MAGTWYRTGTVGVTANSKKVTGSGTAWDIATSGVAKGVALVLPAGSSVDIYEIDYVESATVLWLVDNYRGSTGTGKTYAIDITRANSIPELTRKVVATLSYHQANLDVLQQLYTSTAATITITAPDGTEHELIPWKKITGDGDTQLALATAQADRAEQEADRAQAEADGLAATANQAALDALAKEAPERHPFRGKLPSLILDFARNQHWLAGDFGLEKKTLAELITVSSGASTRVDHRGIIVPTVANQPVITHDPATGLNLGLSVNLPATNRLLWSEDTSKPAWSSSEYGVTDSGLASPLQGVNYQRYTAPSDNASNSFLQVIPPVSSQLTISLFVGDETNVRLLFSIDDGGSNSARASVDPVTGSILLTNPVGAGSVIRSKSYAGGKRIAITFPVIANASRAGVLIKKSSSISYSSDLVAGDVFDYTGVMVETGEAPTRYIKTEGSTVSRVAEFPQRTLGAEFNPRAGTLYLHQKSASIDDRFSLTIGVDSSNYLGINHSASFPFFFVPFGGGASIPNSNHFGDHRFSVSWEIIDDNNLRIIASRDGQLLVDKVESGDTSLIHSWNLLGLGHRFGAFNRNLEAPLVMLYPTALSASEHQELTA